MKFCFSLVLLSCCSFVTIAQKNHVRIAFYNVENIFDTIDDPKTADEEFTPAGKSNWNTPKYLQKLDHTATVIHQLNGDQGPDLIGFSEIENKKVLQDLVAQPTLKKDNYAIVHFDSPDERGIDVALLYKKEVYKEKGTHAYTIRFPFDTVERTRDFLLVKGELIKNKTKLYLIVNHWPSKRGGDDESKPRRLYVAAQVRQVVDSIAQKEPDAHFVLIGDFNDTPLDESLTKSLKAGYDSTLIRTTDLFNMMYGMALKGMGTHYYKKEKNMLDQVIVSGNLLSGKKLYTRPYDAHIFERDWLMEKHPKSGDIQPFRTYAGSKYLGGYSDHLPVYVDLYLR